MRFFYSPKILFGILFGRIPDQSFFAKDSNWFFSEEGLAAYRKARSPADRAAFYAEYLNISIPNETIAYKCAVLFANAVDGTRFSFAKYPEILLEDCNPLLPPIIDLAKYGYVSYEQSVEPIIQSLHNRLNMQEKTDAPIFSVPDKNKNVSELYVLERYILSLFCQTEKNRFGPYRL